KVSGGLHGVGVSCVNALSNQLIATVHRDGKVFRQEYSKGIPKAPVAEIGETDKTGTIVHFKPDDSIFNETVYKYETVASRMRELAYLNAGIRIYLVDKREKDDNDEFRSDEFFSEGGLKEFVEYLDSTREPLIPEPIFMSIDKGEIPVEVAMSYNTSYTENVVSYVNNINTIEGGTHVSGFRRALTRTLKSYADRSGLL
ncbi:MAG: DNA topoisomerase IV subunit B, partial [Cyclobacteriaceae bacterium]